jgi:putative oxidoreductase
LQINWVQKIYRDRLVLSNFLVPFIGSFDIPFGILILLGLLTRLTAIPLIIRMIVEMATSNVEVLANEGLWSMMDSSRTYWSMFPGSIFVY